MLDALRFVRGGVAKKDLIPVLTHFAIDNGRLQATNGKLTISTVCSELRGLSLTVPADKFFTAVDSCDGEPTLNVTGTGKLTVKRGKFRALLSTGELEHFPWSHPQRLVRVPYVSIDCLRTVEPFIAEDASRPWACGVLLDGYFAYATNNVVLARTRLPDDALSETFDQRLNMPGDLVREIMRINDPDYTLNLDVETNCMFVVYQNGSWIKSPQLANEWPDVTQFFTTDNCTFTQHPILAELVRKVVPFCPDPKFPQIKFNEQGVFTIEGASSAIVECSGLSEGVYHAEPLLQVLDVADEIDFSKWPSPVPFRTHDGTLQGVLVGLRG